jgi:hypothetical protein
MTQFTSPQAKELETIIAELPVDKIQEVLDFAHYLRLRYVSKPERGSTTAILATLEDVGSLQFEEGELDSLLTDIEAMRQMDLQDHV